MVSVKNTQSIIKSINILTDCSLIKAINYNYSTYHKVLLFLNRPDAKFKRNCTFGALDISFCF